jgi:hypothetical protein
MQTKTPFPGLSPAQRNYRSPTGRLVKTYRIHARLSTHFFSASSPSVLTAVLRYRSNTRCSRSTEPLLTTPSFLSCFLMYTRLPHFHDSMPRKKRKLAIKTMPHSQLMPLCLNTVSLMTGMYKTGKMVTKAKMIEKKRNLLRQTSIAHCVKYFVDPGCIAKNERRKSNICHARKTENHVRQANVVARARKTVSQVGL